MHLLVGDSGQISPFGTIDDPYRVRGLPEDPLQTAVGVLRCNHHGTPDVEVYTRLVRDLEEYLGWPSGKPIPLRVAALVVFPRETTGGDWNGRSWLIERDPALWALLFRSLRPRELAVFA